MITGYLGGPTHLNTHLEPWIVDSVKKHAGGPQDVLPVNYMWGLEALPHDSEIDPDWVPAVVIYLELALDGGEHSVYRSIILAPFTLTKELIDQQIGEAIADLRGKAATFAALGGKVIEKAPEKAPERSPMTIRTTPPKKAATKSSRSVAGG